jgi:hypothetical protein
MNFLCILGVLLAVIGCASIDPGPVPKIDGNLGHAEWRSAEAHAIAGGGTVRLRRIGTDLYIAVSAVESGFPTIFVGNADTIDVLHASAALASVRYIRSGDTWTPVTESFNYTLRQNSDGTQAPKAARDDFLEANNWLSISDRSHGLEREFLVRLDSERQFLAISFLGIPSMRIYSWPASMSDSTEDLRLLRGEVPSELKFSPGSWRAVGQQPNNSFMPKPLRGSA